MTSTIGVMQFLVQLAQEMMRGAPCGTFAPCTTVSTSPSFDGADRRTNRAPARMCFSRSSRRVSAPVHSKHELDAEILPRQLRWITAPQGPQLATGDGHVASVDDHGLWVAA